MKGVVKLVMKCVVSVDEGCGDEGCDEIGDKGCGNEVW